MADLHPLHPPPPSLPLPATTYATSYATDAATDATTSSIDTAIDTTLIKPPMMASRDAVTDDSDVPMRCCCGRVDCVFLRHNCTLLDSVEKEVHTAARMGQVSCLLGRMSTHVALK